MSGQTKVSLGAPKKTTDLKEHFLKMKQLYSDGQKTFGGGIVVFDDASKCFRHTTVTGFVTIYSGLEKTIKKLFWPNKPPPSFNKKKHPTSADKRFAIACENFDSQEVIPVKGKELGKKIHNEIDTLFRQNGRLSSKDLTINHHPRTHSIVKKLENEGFEVIGTEVVVWDPGSGIASKIDIVAKKGGRIYMIELKVGYYGNFFYYNEPVIVESINEELGEVDKKIKIRDSPYNRARVQSGSGCILFCGTYNIPIRMCTAAVLWCPKTATVNLYLIKQDFIFNEVAMIYAQVCETKKEMKKNK